MNVLVACEESQTITKAFREHGFTAFSCDLQNCSGGRPEWHIKCDVLDVLNGRCFFETEDGETRYYIPTKWDLIIAHPPCTYLTVTGNKWFKPDRKKTCLWLKGLPLLVPTELVEPELITFKNGHKMSKAYSDASHLTPAERSRVRSKTSEGVARAIVEQWGKYLNGTV